MRIALIATLIFVSQSVFAQIQIGLKGGLNLSTAKTTGVANLDNLDFKSIISPTFGVTSQIELSEKFDLDMDFLFTGRGYKVFDFETKLYYLELPVLLAYSPLEKLKVELGPDFLFKIGVKSNHAGIDFESIRTIDVGMATGVQYDLTETVFISARYYHGLTSITTLYRTYSSDSKTFNRAFQFTVGYLIERNN